MQNANLQPDKREPLGKKMNLFQRVASGNVSKDDLARLIVFGACIVVFIICIVYMGIIFSESASNEELNTNLQNLYSNPETANTNTLTEANTGGTKDDYYPPSYQEKFRSLYDQNVDLMGWIEIPGTNVNYPVVQSGDNLFYERRDFLREESQHGIPFLDFRSYISAEDQSTNLVIYGHNMTDGQMFANLLNYSNVSFYKSHPVVTFDSVYADGDYVIFGAVISHKDDPDFQYHNFVNTEDANEFNDYIDSIRERSLINTTIDVVPGDDLLTLSTCDYSFGSSTDRVARFVVFARKLRPDETTNIDVSGATINTAPVMPSEWYAQIAKDQAEAIQQQIEADAAKVLEEWLFDDEREDLSLAEQEKLANERKELIESYLTYDEIEDLAKYLDEMLYLADERKDLFELYLTEDETYEFNLRKRIATVYEREDLAEQWLTEAEIKDADSWEELDELITQKQAGQSEDVKWLTEQEMSTLSDAEKTTLMNERKAEAAELGITEAEIVNTANWAAMQSLMTQKEIAIEKTQYIQTNRVFIDGTEETKSLNELKSLVETRKAQAAAVNVDTSAYKSWAALSTAIKEAQANADQTALIDNLIASNPKWLEVSDKANKTLAQLEELMADRKERAEEVSVDHTKYETWETLERAIENAEEEIKAINTLVSKNPKWLMTSDKEDNDLDDLQLLMAQRQQQAQNAGINPDNYQTWAQIKAAIDNPPSTTPANATAG